MSLGQVAAVVVKRPDLAQGTPPLQLPALRPPGCVGHASPCLGNPTGQCSGSAGDPPARGDLSVAGRRAAPTGLPGARGRARLGGGLGRRGRRGGRRPARLPLPPPASSWAAAPEAGAGGAGSREDPPPPRAPWSPSERAALPAAGRHGNRADPGPSAAAAAAAAGAVLQPGPRRG